MTDKQKLIKQAVKLMALGYEVENKRSIVKRIYEVSSEPTMELFRAIDEFNIAKMEFEALESEYLVLQNKITATEK